jgi:ribosomal protein L44E
MDMTIERWRRFRRSTATTQRDPWSRLLAAARRVVRHGERHCDHLHDTVSRYDHAAKRLELLLTCPDCETEKVIHSLAYEPRFEPSVASVHALHLRGAAAVYARPLSVGGTAGLRRRAVIERRDGTCESPIAAAEIPIDRTAHGAMSC